MRAQRRLARGEDLVTSVNLVGYRPLFLFDVSKQDRLW